MRKAILVIMSVFAMSAQAASFPGYAEGRYAREHADFVRDYAERSGRDIPEVKEYRYGMTLDVANVIRVSRDPATCGVFRRMMTFENSVGELETVSYSMLSRCIGEN